MVKNMEMLVGDLSYKLREFAKYRGELIDNPHVSEPV